MLPQKRGERRTPVATGPPAPWGHCGTHSPPSRKGNCGGASVNENGGSGRWRRNSGTAAPRAPLTPKLEGTCSAREAAAAVSATWDHPGRPSPNSPKSSGHRRQWAQRGSAERDTAGGPRAPNVECSEKGFRRPRTCPRSPLAVQQIAGPWSSRRGAAHGCEVGRVDRQSAQDVGGGGPEPDCDAVTFGDPQTASGRARARCGPGPRGPARAL